jgi:hypothetical protein
MKNEPSFLSFKKKEPLLSKRGEVPVARRQIILYVHHHFRVHHRVYVHDALLEEYWEYWEYGEYKEYWEYWEYGEYEVTRPL